MTRLVPIPRENTEYDMPKENDTRPCTHSECTGTQTFTHNADIAGFSPPWAWICEKHLAHYDIVEF